MSSTKAGLNEDLIKKAIYFLQNPKTKDSSREKKEQFLKSKGLKPQDIKEAFERYEKAEQTAKQEEQVKAQVVEKQSEAVLQDRSIKMISLKNQNLQEFPQKIFDFTILQILVLSNNQIKKISEEIYLLQDLKSFHISHNQITQLPAELFLLSNLKDLNVSHNEIQSIQGIENLFWSLRRLNVSYNKLTTIDGVEFCTLLEVIFMQNNLIQKLPTLQALVNLRQINLQSNPLQVELLEAQKKGSKFVLDILFKK